MLGPIFKNRIDALSVIHLPLPYCKDKLFEVCHIIFAWNQHMKYVLIPLGVSFSDESIFK